MEHSIWDSHEEVHLRLSRQAPLGGHSMNLLVAFREHLAQLTSQRLQRPGQAF